MEIYHNPRCAKSREVLALIQNTGQAVDVIHYLQNTPSRSELKTVLLKLGMKPSELVRKGEQLFKDEFKGKELSEEEWLDAMVKYPKLIERPIVVKGDKAVIGRPPENVLKLF